MPMPAAELPALTVADLADLDADTLIYAVLDPAGTAESRAVALATLDQWLELTVGAGIVQSVAEGDDVLVDDTDPANPVVGVDPASFVRLPAVAPTSAAQILGLSDDDPLTTDWIDAPAGGAQIGPSTVTAQSGAYSAANRDIVLANANGAAFSVALPAPTAGAWVTVKKVDASVNAVTVTTPGAETIDGAATYVISTQWTSRDFVSDGTNWYLV